METDRLAAIEQGREGDPFAVLGPHPLGAGTVVRTFLPGARNVSVIDENAHTVARAEAVGDAGIFEAYAPEMPPHYRLRVEYPLGSQTIEDPYRFGPLLGDLDMWLFAQGNHHDLYRVLGAHPREIDGAAGTQFAVWAPNAARVSVVGDWNHWDGRMHPMRLRREAGVWEIFLPGVGPGARYKYELLGPGGDLLPLRADPFAQRSEKRPDNASVVAAPPAYEWTDAEWLQARGAKQRRDAPIQIYEVHLGSWRRIPEQGDRFLTYARARRPARPVRRRARLHAHRAAAGHRAPVRSELGLSDHGLVRAHQPLRRAGRLSRVRRRRAPRRDRRDPRLGARPLPHRRARPGQLRRHAAVRARRPARRLPPRVGHVRVQPRPQRGGRTS